MRDTMFVAGTLLFFAAMLGYVKACARLGRGQDTEAGHDAR